MAQVIITSLDMVPGDVQERVYISQSDTGFRELQFYLYARGSLYEIPSGAAAVLNGRKPDATAFSYQMEIIDTHTVKIAVQQQMSSVAGDTTCEVAIIAASEKIGSANFILHVEEAPIADAVMSESDYALFIEAIDAAGSIASVEQIVEDLNDLEAQITADEADMNLWMKQGTLIVSGSDLITGTIPGNPGKYYASNATLAQTLVNCPTQLGFALWVCRQTSADARVLLLIDSGGNIYADRVTNTGTGFDATTHTGWRRLLNADDLSTVNTALSAKAPLASPTLTGTPTVPTPDGNTALQAANVSFVNSSIANISNATQQARGMMSAADKKYLDQSGSVEYTDFLALTNVVIDGTSCYVSSKRGSYADVDLYLKLHVIEANVSATTRIIEGLPKPRIANPPVVLSTKSGDSVVVGYISAAGNFLNSAAMTQDKTYYGSLHYKCNNADDGWYE